MLLATARPASWSVPRWPTTAVSHEDVERLGHERAERGHGQAQDLAVVRVARNGRRGGRRGSATPVRRCPGGPGGGWRRPAPRSATPSGTIQRQGAAIWVRRRSDRR